MKNIIYTTIAMCLFYGVSHAQNGATDILNGDQCPTSNIKIEFNHTLEQPGQIYPDLTFPDEDGDGISDLIECPYIPCRDTDEDGIPDFQDLDSDEDGLSDEYEGNIYTDQDALPNYRDLDSDHDGTPDSLDNCYLEKGIYPDDCPFTERRIFWVHGYRGNHRSWEKVATQETNTYKNGLLQGTGTYQAESHLISYTDDQSSLEESAKRIRNQIGGKVTKHDIETERNFIIAHSLGGLAARKMGRLENVNDSGKPAFNGLVTFGTPHMGAAAANTLVNNSDFLESYLTKTCQALSAGPAIDKIIQKDSTRARISNVIASLGLVTSVVDLTCDLGIGFVFEPIVEFMKTGIEHELTTTSVASLPAMNTEHNAAFYGIEDDTEGSLFARFKGAIDNSPTDEAIYKGDTTDQKGLATMAANIDFFQSRHDYYEAKSHDPTFIWNNKKNKNIALAYARGIDWFNSVNDNWKTIITGYETEVIKTGCQCTSEDEYGNRTSTFYPTDESCLTFLSDNLDTECYATLQWNMVHKPSDGFILAESAMNMPNANYDPTIMEGSNHFQMKNDKNTQIAMEAIFLNGLGGPFFGTKLR